MSERPWKSSDLLRRGACRRRTRARCSRPHEFAVGPLARRCSLSRKAHNVLLSADDVHSAERGPFAVDVCREPLEKIKTQASSIRMRSGRAIIAAQRTRCLAQILRCAPNRLAQDDKHREVT